MNTIEITSVVIGDDESLVTSVQKKNKLDNFQAIGRINSMHTKTKPIKTDIFSELRKVSKPAYELFDDLKNARNPVNNITCISTAEKTASELTMYRTRIKELKDLSIIKKAKTWDRHNPVKKGSFMINPNFIKCPADQERALLIWDSL